MKILILEDSPERIIKFKELFKNQELYIFGNAHLAFCECLYTEFNIMLLDHDLDGRIWVDSDEENTGFAFIKFLVAALPRIQTKALIYIHSMNPIGANKMLNLLKDDGRDGIWIPFPQLKINNE